MYFLIRTNVENEGWTTDGVFAPNEAREQIAAILGSEQIAEHEGHHFEFRIFGLLDGAPTPSPLETERVDGHFLMRLPISKHEVMNVPLPRALDY